MICLLYYYYSTIIDIIIIVREQRETKSISNETILPLAMYSSLSIQEQVEMGVCVTFLEVVV